MATIDILDAPKQLTMVDFKSISEMYNGLQKSCRFLVRILPVGQFLQPYGTFMRDFTYLCEVAEHPGRSFMNADVRYYGPNHKLPYQTQYEDINLTFICRNYSLERQFFDDWQLIVNPVNTWDFNYRDQYRAAIDIYQYEEAADPAAVIPNLGPIGFGASVLPTQRPASGPRAQYWIRLYNAYPILVNSQPVTWADDQFQRLIVSFTYTHWTRPGIDPTPRTNAPGGFSFNLVEGSSVLR